MPVVSDPWFEMPLATEWTTTEEGRTTVTCVETHRVKIRGTPSVFGMPVDILKAMNELDAHVAELERDAHEQAQASAKAGSR